MKILFICYKIPSSTDALTYRVFHALKYMKCTYNYNITLVAASGYDFDMVPVKDKKYLKKYTDKMFIFPLPSSRFKRILTYTKDYLVRLFSGNMNNYFDFTFNREMEIKINQLVNDLDPDIVFVDTPYALPYGLKINSKKVIELWDIKHIYLDAIKNEKNIFKRLSLSLLYLKIKNYERYYTAFDKCIFPSKEDIQILESYIPEIKTSFVPFGVSTEFNGKWAESEEDYPSILFFGIMNDPYNPSSAMYIYEKIFPEIKKSFPETKFYIVGKNPTVEIRDLSLEDSSVIVTGYVEDIKPYLLKSSVITVPTHRFGVKTRILEAMAAGRPVVTNSNGLNGINAKPYNDIIIADEIHDFVEETIKLLAEENLRDSVGKNAQKQMKKEHSWKKATDELNNLFTHMLKGD